ncbi:nucleotidyltransferase family protein [Defluviimonas sp. D31]|uniref:nucleotidyltransferase family protein n=1 Tax=Defluviimonas sp. D31 TaxID=3083253 RepID=UPI00296E565E|nr:nucleotidyltransferase family protein [Defluviimonas sp. D31]MDW4549732.1 nucleotidyltransferase family protein [Defluviimonas sp. D31]
MKVVIQCGGKGTRLRPYTMVLPKPLMPVQSQPVLELLLKWLRRNDVRDVYITTGYLGHLIRAFCGDGRQWSMNIRYTIERQPLGTIGPLGMLRDELDSTFMVINGDVLTDLSIGAFAACHHRSGGLVTVATALRETPLEFGVIDAPEGRVKSFKEKPSLTNLMSMGIYCMEPEALEYVPDGVPFGFDDLMYCLLARDKPVYTYRHDGLWLDIGRVDDFQSAQILDWDEQSPAHERLGAVS